jgi:hypothetical protein
MTDVWSRAGAPSGISVIRRVSVKSEAGSTATLSQPVPAVGSERVSSTGQITWQLPDQGRGNGAFLVNAPRVRCAVGFTAGRPVELGDVTFTVTSARKGWAAMGLAALDDQPIQDSSRMLLVAVGQVGNSGMKWNEERTSVAGNWGHQPTIAEGISATIGLPGTAAVQVLTAGGKASDWIPVQSSGDTTEFRIGPQYQTLWYLITRPR